MLTPADIEKIRFSTTRLLKEGYDQSEVDGFLDRIVEDYKFLTQQVAKLESDNATLRRQVDNQPTAQLAPVVEPPSAVVEKLLAAAQQAHDEHVADGKVEADRIVRDAGAEGARIVEEAQAAAERIKSEGLAEKYRRNEELDKKATQLTAVIEDLNDRGQRVKHALTDALNSVRDL